MRIITSLWTLVNFDFTDENRQIRTCKECEKKTFLNCTVQSVFHAFVQSVRKILNHALEDSHTYITVYFLQKNIQICIALYGDFCFSVKTIN